MDYNLFLDDIRTPESAAHHVYWKDVPVYLKNRWEIARNYDEFVKMIQEKGLPKIVSFDHDLAAIHYDPATWSTGFEYSEKTGMDCAKWLVEYCLDNKLKLPQFYVHSQNPVGRENIKRFLHNFKNQQDG